MSNIVRIFSLVALTSIHDIFSKPTCAGDISFISYKAAVRLNHTQYLCLDITQKKKHSSCEIEAFVETPLRKLCVILRSRVLRVVLRREGHRSATLGTAA